MTPSRCPIRRHYRFITTVLMALPFWFCCFLQQANSWALHSVQPKSFVTMYTEGPQVLPPPLTNKPFWKQAPSKNHNLNNHHAFLFRDHPKNKEHASPRQRDGTSSKNKHGMPWKTSIGDEQACSLGNGKNAASCLFMPFWEQQLDHFQNHLSNFTIDKDHFVVSKNKNVRMVTLSASSDEYRLIRMTYLDGGSQTQIFTSVAYPRGNLPILGCDLLSFAGGKRNLAIVDFQPIHDQESHHDTTYEHLLRPTRDMYKSLQEPMSNRFFDPSQFFSGQTLLGRFGGDDESKSRLWTDLFPAWQSYLQTHVGIAKKYAPVNGHGGVPIDIESYHKAYDTYCLARDPAHPMFNSLFGPDFADDFLYNTMFPLAERPESNNEEVETAMG